MIILGDLLFDYLEFQEEKKLEKIIKQKKNFVFN